LSRSSNGDFFHVFFIKLWRVDAMRNSRILLLFTFSGIIFTIAATPRLAKNALPDIKIV
jgi:hypothetical protein